MQPREIINTIDTHTAGGPTRIVVSGLPHIKGENQREKKEYFKTRLDQTRKMLMQEPRGHAGMFGAILTPPCVNEADTGVFFTTTSGYLDMCVHSAIGVAAAMWGTGVKSVEENICILDTPSGIIPVERVVQKGGVSFRLTTNPAFVCSEGDETDFPGLGKVKADVVFSGVYFLMIGLDQYGVSLSSENAKEITGKAPGIIKDFNSRGNLKSPLTGNKEKISMVLFYNKIDRRKGINLVVSASGAADRSPCGAGTGAMMTLMNSRGLLGINESYTNMSLTGTSMKGYLAEGEFIDGLKTAVPNIASEAYITGFHRFVADRNDLLDPFLL